MRGHEDAFHPRKKNHSSESQAANDDKDFTAVVKGFPDPAIFRGVSLEWKLSWFPEDGEK